ncbi:TOMM precursor leader peptide-binding protein [Microbispora sp. NPDC046933]|uniref:TOMM precursor leader peptide-binding protein n=1 Tax=Microbispora sp. NPDC046933 TaxID=3155618 RepID=UPI00340F3A86
MTEGGTKVARKTVRIGMAGQGLLYEASRDLLAGDHEIVPLSGGDPGVATAGLGLVLVVTDGMDEELRHRVNDLCLREGVPLLPVHVEPGKAVVGPAVLPDEPGCLVCAQSRRLRARSDLENYSTLLERHGDRVSAIGRMWLTPFAAGVLGEIVAEEAARIIGGREGMRTRGALVSLTLDGLRSRLHRILPDPLCDRCGRLPDDSRQAAELRLRSRPKVSPGSHRVRSLDGEKDRLFDLFVDDDAGLLRAVHKEGRNIFPGAVAPMGLRATFRTEMGFGHQLDYRTSQITAVAEALERYGGIEPGGKRTTVRASFAELGARALDPKSLGLHTDEQYDLPGNHYVRYHDELVFNWVWGYSFRRREPILVPENYAYYGTVYRNTRDHPFVYEISNGCALGGCLEEAILHGIFEVAERDAFLMTWYARLPVPRVDPRTARDRSVPLVVESIESATGYEIEIFNTTLEHGIPSFWAMAVDRRDRPGLPKALCAAGAHLNPEKAVRSALMELAPLLSRPPEYYRDRAERIERMVEDPYAVAVMEDHALLNGAPQVFGRFGFLYGSAVRQSFEEAFPDHYRKPANADLLDDLTDVVGRYLGTGMDVIVVDQTTPEHAAADFRCVKVIIPGCLPMTFGHHARRVSGFERLHRLPQQLGYSDRPLTDADVNPHPHPFP